MGTPFEPPTTPPHTHVSNALTNDTPISLKKGPSVAGSEYHVDVSRDGLMQDLGPLVPQVPFEFFTKNILPPLSSTVNVADVVAKLKARNAIANGRWKAFPCDPRYVRSESDEDKTFSALKTIITEIIESSGLGTATTVDYQNNPNHIPLCDYVQKDGRPDGYMVFRHKGKPKPKEERVRWREVCCIGEYKLKDQFTDIKDNVAKTCWNMYKAMHEDPRRRFVHAFTIENTTMRLWMGNRSAIVVSDMFDFMTDHEKVVYFFLSQLYAEEHELGLDPTMRLILPIEGPKPMYDIDVRVSGNTTLTYRTTELINDDNAAALCGRGTRVWSVVKVVDDVEDPKQTGVLKDCWVDVDRTREGDILEQIRNSDSLDDDFQQILNSSLLTVLAHGDVFVHDIRDSTRDVMLRGADLRPYPKFDLRNPDRPVKTNKRILKQDKPKRSSRSAATAGTSSITTPAEDNAKDIPPLETVCGDAKEQDSRVRYRIVFQEKCTPLYELDTLQGAFKCVAQLIGPLQLLHEAGWVHRDISTGNILIDKDGNLRLADFEYAKRLDDNRGSHDFRTGTSYYMSTEVDIGEYLYTSASSKSSKNPVKPGPKFVVLRKKPAVLDTANTGSPDPNRSSDTPDQNKATFRHNPLHDMESGWWISLELLINKERRFATSKGVAASSNPGPPPPGKDISLTDDDRKYARRVFYSFAHRISIMSGTGRELRGVLDGLPRPIASIGTKLLELRLALAERYREVEITIPPVAKDACTPELYAQFDEAFWNITTTLDDLDDIKLSPLIRSREQLAGYRTSARKEATRNGVNSSASMAGPSGAGKSTGSGSKRRSNRTTAQGSKKMRMEE